MASVTFDGVTKKFGDVTAVDDLHLEIHDGEFLVLLGPSGCGKTTAMRLIAGLEDVTSGELRIGDERVNERDARKRDVAMVFQSYALYPHLTVAKNIASPLKVREYVVDGSAEPRRLTRAEQRERVEAAAEMLDLVPYLSRKPGALSGGQRQRVALARAIVARPKVFLMDEPLSNLDAKLRTQTRAELVDLHRRLGTTIAYVTHDQVEAMTMATRIAVMADGHLQQVGTSAEVYNTPANLFVARFIGTPPMNTFTAIVTEDGTAVRPTATSTEQPGGAEVSGTLPLAADQVALVSPGQAVVVGIRPEHLGLVEAASSAGADALARQATVVGGLEGTVTNIEWLGHEAVVMVDSSGIGLSLRQGADRGVPQVGQRTTVVAEPGYLHLFDPESTKRFA